MSPRSTPPPGRAASRPDDPPLHRAASRRIGPARPPGAVRRARQVLLALVLLLVVTGAAVALLASPLLEVRTVEVTGTERLTPEQVTVAAAVRGGSSLATVDADGIGDRVGALPTVASVAVHRSWPHTVRLVVTERVPRAYEAQPDGSVRLFDAEGADFAAAATPPAGLPALALPSGQTRPAAARAAMTVLADLPDGLRTQVQTVRGRSPSQVVLGLLDDRTVLWGAAGDAADTATKAAIVATLEQDRLARAIADGVDPSSDVGLEIDVSAPTVAVVR